MSSNGQNFWKQRINRIANERLPEKKPPLPAIEPTQLLVDGKEAGKVFRTVRRGYPDLILFCDQSDKKNPAAFPVHTLAVKWCADNGIAHVVAHNRSMKRMRLATVAQLQDRPVPLIVTGIYNLATCEDLPNTAPWFDVPTCKKTIELYQRDEQVVGTQPGLLE